MSAIYYVYVNEETNRYYYYDAISQETTYSRPKSGAFLDPITKEAYQFPENDTRSGGPRKSTHHKHTSTSATIPSSSGRVHRKTVTSTRVRSPPSVIIASTSTPVVGEVSTTEPPSGSDAIVEQTAHRLPGSSPLGFRASLPIDGSSQSTVGSAPAPPGPTPPHAIPPAVPPSAPTVPPTVTPAVAPSASATAISTVKIEDPPTAFTTALPEALKSDIHQFQVAEFVRKFFRERRKGGIFSRKTITVESLSNWQSTPIKGPLLKNMPARLTKLAVELFKLILSYTGAEASVPPGNVMNLTRLVTSMTLDEELRDEIYMQLIKQTRENGNLECLYNTWEVFLLVATIFPSSRDSEECIKAHIISCSKDFSEKIAEISQFTFIRYTARCCIGKPLEGPFLPPTLRQIMVSHHQSIPQFDASLHEQVWCQRNRFSMLPIPIMIHRIAGALLAAGAENTEGIFRLPGNMKKVRELQQAISQGEFPLENCEVHDLGSLFKSWFSSLPEPIVQKDVLPMLRTAFEENSLISFADKLPQLARLTLKYLVGFLKRIASFSEVTRMGVSNLAIVFAPNVVDMSCPADPLQMARVSETGKEFMIVLINEWDVSEMYPLPPEMLVEAQTN
jgi:hypothetical protein